MVKVWKFPLIFIAEQTIDVPLAAELFHVEAIQKLTVNTRDVRVDSAVIYGEPSYFVWGRVWDDTNLRCQRRRIFIVGTGHQAPPHPHLATVVTAGGAYVWHFFLQQRPEPIE